MPYETSAQRMWEITTQVISHTLLYLSTEFATGSHICVVKRDTQEIADAHLRRWQNTLNVSLIS